jgi:nicotinate-nucleotide adenylyltransferase
MKNLPIGIFGGTFDPIHLGHLHLAVEVYQQLNLKEIRFIPCNQSSLKQQPIASGAHRLEMIKLAIKDYPQFNVDDCEISRRGISYAVDTLKFLHKKFHGFSFCFIMSMDAFAQFNLWHKWQEILTLTHLIIANRPDSTMPTNQEVLQLLEKHQTFNPEDLVANIVGKIYFLNIKPNPISATMIRSFLKEGKEASAFLPQPVWNYIQQHHLYNAKT